MYIYIVAEVAIRMEHTQTQTHTNPHFALNITYAGTNLEPILRSAGTNLEPILRSRNTTPAL
jgi:hypothetical protein